MTHPYLFTSPRLGFRLWQPKDLPLFAAMNADAETMTFFAKPLTEQESDAMMTRMNKMYADHGYCYFAVDLIETSELMGMIGLGYKNFESDFTPCTDIGWRIRKKFWNQGIGTEGAQRCLDFAKAAQIPEVLSMATTTNLASIRIMQKIGMKYWKDFDHPDLKEHPHLNPLCLYRTD